MSNVLLHPTVASRASGSSGNANAEQNSRTDRELMQAFLDGNSHAFAILATRYRLLVFQVLRRYTRESEDTLDLLQRTYVRALEAAHGSFPKLLRSEDFAFRSWLLRIALNLAKNYVRDNSRRRYEPIIDESGPTTTNADALEAEEQRTLLRDALGKLTPRLQELVTLRIDSELSFAEIGATLGITEGNAKSQFHYALKRLSALIAHQEEP